MPPQTPSTPRAVPDPSSTPTAIAATATTATAATKEDDDSRAGSMTLLLPQQATMDKQADQGLPMPPLPPLQRPRKRLVLVRRRPSRCNGSTSTWVLALLAVAAIMAAVAAAAIAMAAKAEIFRLKADVDHLKNRLQTHELMQNFINGVLEPGMAPVPVDDEDTVWDEPQGPNPDDLSPSYPDNKEFEFPADVKSNTARHSRRHIPTVGGSYGGLSSENGWRPGKSEKRLKLYEALATGTFAPEIAVPAVPSAPTKSEASALSGHYHLRSNSDRLVAPSHLAASHVAALTAPSADKVVVARRQDDV